MYYYVVPYLDLGGVLDRSGTPEFVFRCAAYVIVCVSVSVRVRVPRRLPCFPRLIRRNQGSQAQAEAPTYSRRACPAPSRAIPLKW